MQEINHQELRPQFVYQVAMPQPQFHLFQVTLNIDRWQSETLNLRMPVWTPGSYLVREYARNIQSFQARDRVNGKLLKVNKIAKNAWNIATKNTDQIAVNYTIFARELSVRTNHLDSSHGYFNGAALFCFIPEFTDYPWLVEIIPPYPQWQVSTSLPLYRDKNNTFIARDFDTLVDSPFEIGTQKIYEFQALGKKHQIAVWGEGNADPQQIVKDTQKIIKVEANLYGGLPYDRYLFILHLSASGFGGLEHKNSCSLNYPRFGFRAKDKYQRFMQLVAHEFFHLWNIKRIRPQALEKFDYERENYTSSLWFSEGTTSYYDLLIPLRAGIFDRQTFLDNLGKEITRFLNIPGRKVQPLAESSFDAWIKLYRRDANSDNCQISYYLKGELISLLLDLLIRSRHQNKRSLDDVMRRMWQQFGKEEIGFTPAQLQDTIASVAETDLDDFFQRYLYSTEELPFNEYLEPFGLQVNPVEEDEPYPYLGIKVKTENNREAIKFVASDSPAASAGIDANDELLAIDGMRVNAEQLNERLKNYQPGDRIRLSVFQGDELKTLSVQLASPQPSRYQVVSLPNLSATQKQNFTGWLAQT